MKRSANQKNPRAHKNKIGTPPPPKKKKPNTPPPQTEEFYGHGFFFCRKNAFFQAPIKLAQPFPAPELRTNNFTDTRIFLSKPMAENAENEPVCSRALWLDVPSVLGSCGPREQCHSSSGPQRGTGLQMLATSSWHYHTWFSSEIPWVLLGIPWPALRGPLRNHFWKKRGVPSRTEGERILEVLWKPQMPWLIGLGGSQPYSRERNSRKRSESVSGVFPELFRNFFRKVPAVLGVWLIRTGGQGWRGGEPRFADKMLWTYGPFCMSTLGHWSWRETQRQHRSETFQELLQVLQTCPLSSHPPPWTHCVTALSEWKREIKRIINKYIYIYMHMLWEGNPVHKMPSQKGNLVPDMCPDSLGTVSRLFSRGFARSRGGAEIVPPSSPWGLRKGFLALAWKTETLKFRQIRLKRVFWLFCLFAQSYDIKKGGDFRTFFGSVRWGFRGVFGMSRNHLFCRLKRKRDFRVVWEHAFFSGFLALRGLTCDKK